MKSNNRYLPLQRNGVRASTAGQLQRKCACGGMPGPTGKCGACRNEKLQRHPRRQRSAVSQVPGLVHEVLRSPGQPLPQETRSFMEPRFGRDFSYVRVHGDAKAAESARAVNALAYTVGSDVVFGAEQYAPHSKSGQALLAHELAHVAQQWNERDPSPVSLAVGPANSEAEKEAERVAGNISLGHAAASANILPLRKSLQRQPVQPELPHDDKGKDKKEATAHPPPQEVPASDKTETKDAEITAAGLFTTESKTEAGKIKTELSRRFEIEATIPLTDKFHLGRYLFFVKDVSGSLGGKLNFTDLDYQMALKTISLELNKLKVPLGLVDVGFSGSIMLSAQEKGILQAGAGVGIQGTLQPNQGPVFIKLGVGLQKNYSKEGSLNFKWDPMLFTTFFSIGYKFK